MRWRMIAAGAVVVFGAGIITGRRFLPRTITTVEYPKSPDGGVPSAVATVTTGQAFCDAGVRVVIKQVPSKADAGICPACPEVVVEASSSATTAPATATADAPMAPPLVVHEVQYRDSFKVWGLGPAVSFPYAGGIGYGGAFTVQPFSWLEFNGQITSKEASTNVQVRF